MEILTTSFDLYVKKRQLNKFNETEIPKFYDDIKSRNKDKPIVTEDIFFDSQKKGAEKMYGKLLYANFL